MPKAKTQTATATAAEPLTIPTDGDEQHKIIKRSEPLLKDAKAVANARAALARENVPAGLEGIALRAMLCHQSA